MVQLRVATSLSLFFLFAILAISYAFESKSDQDHSLTRNKRGWNGAKGMWGKRDAADADEEFEDMEKRGWNKASGMWGKRSEDDEFGSPLEEKRGTWSKASGMWGKRAGWNGAKGMWGKRKRSVPMVSDSNRR